LGSCFLILRIRIAWISEAKGSGNLRAARRELNHASNIRQPSKLSRIESTTPEIPPHGSIRAHFVVDLANLTPASAEKGYLSAARFMSPELLGRFEPLAREQLKQVVTNRVSQFFTVDSFRVEGKDPLVVRFLGERITYVGRTETENKAYQYRLTLRVRGKNSAEPVRPGRKLG
jgi:TraE protein